MAQHFSPAPAPEDDSPRRYFRVFDDAAVDRLFQELAVCRVKARRERLRQEIILSTLGLSDALAQKYTGRGLDTDDVRQIARLGLIKAVDSFDPSKGFPFGAFAVPTIRGEVRRFFRDTAWAVRPPRRLQELGAHLLDCEARLRQELQHEPTDEELATDMGVSGDEIREVRTSRSAFSSVSLDAPIPGTDIPSQPADTSADAFDAVDQRDALAWAISHLSDRERLIVQLRFEEDFTQQHIGDVLGVSQMQVSRLLVRIIGRLRQQLRTADALVERERTSEQAR